MSGPFGKIKHKVCCCDGGCIGCCFCEQSPAVNADYEIDAPSCATIDGQTGNVSGPAPGSPSSASSCGSCISLVNNASEYAIPQYVWDDSIPENGCVPQSSGNFEFSFFIRCDENAPDGETDPETTEACCKNVRLIITDASGSSTPKAGTSPIAPLSCTCDPFMAVFSLESIFPDCGLGTFASGPCVGLTRCTQLGDPGSGISCNLTGATITFTQSGCPA